MSKPQVNEIQYHWSDPYKAKHHWIIEKVETATGRILMRTPYNSERLAWDFLTTKNFYMNGTLIHSCQ